MEWSKIKNIILLLLLTTNLCLLAFVGKRDWKQEQQMRDAREQAIVFLSRKNVSVDPEEIPEKMTLLPQRVERDRSMEDQAAAALFGDSVQVERKNGEVYDYHSEKGSIRFYSDGAFTADFAPGLIPLGEDREQVCLDTLKKINFQGSLIDTEGDQLTFRQELDGVPLFDRQVVMVCESGSLVAMTAGRRLTGQPVTDETGRPISVASALFNLYNGLWGLGDVCSQINRIDRGYVATASLSGTLILSPVWQVDTDTGRYQLDTMTGALSRLT